MEPFTLQKLVEMYPILLTYRYEPNGCGASKDLIQVLAECGYIFAEIEDIARARNGERTDLSDYLCCRLSKIGQCL